MEASETSETFETQRVDEVAYEADVSTVASVASEVCSSRSQIVNAADTTDDREFEMSESTTNRSSSGSDDQLHGALERNTGTVGQPTFTPEEAQQQLDVMSQTLIDLWSTISSLEAKIADPPAPSPANVPANAGTRALAAESVGEAATSANLAKIRARSRTVSWYPRSHRREKANFPRWMQRRGFTETVLGPEETSTSF